MIRTIGVVGAGAMGHGIAESFAMHGYDVTLFDPSPKALEAATPTIREELELLAEEGFIAAGPSDREAFRVCLRRVPERLSEADASWESGSWSRVRSTNLDEPKATEAWAGEQR